MVKILLFSKLKEITGESTIHIDKNTVEECIVKLCQMYPNIKNELHKCIFVLNQNQIQNLDISTNKSDDLAIIPPVSGG